MGNKINFISNNVKGFQSTNKVYGKLPPGKLTPGRLPPTITLSQPLTLTREGICWKSSWGQFSGHALTKDLKLIKYFKYRIASNSFLFLQETHSTVNYEIKWKMTLKVEPFTPTVNLTLAVLWFVS